jgi:tetratricopeptide (TPR) repeat protein
LYLKNGENSEAMDYYSDMCIEIRGLCLKPDYQIKLEDLYFKSERFKEAALSVKNLIQHLQGENDKENLAKALYRYGALLENHLFKPELAKKMYLQAKHMDGGKISSHTQRMSTNPSVHENRKDAPEHNFKELDENAVYLNGKSLNLENFTSVPLLSVDSRPVAFISLRPEGLVFDKLSQKIIPYSEFKFVTVFQFYGENKFFMDLFLKGEMRPIRIGNEQITYKDIPDFPLSNSGENFKRFTRLLLSKCSGLFTDMETLNFINHSKVTIYLSDNKLKTHEKKIWSRIKDT